MRAAIIPWRRTTNHARAANRRPTSRANTTNSDGTCEAPSATARVAPDVRGSFPATKRERSWAMNDKHHRSVHDIDASRQLSEHKWP